MTVHHAQIPSAGHLPVGLSLRLTQAVFAGHEPSPADLQGLVTNLAQQKIDEAVYPLLPLMAGRAGVLDPDHPIAGKLKGIQRLTWYKNQLVLGRFYRVHDRFVQAGIRTLLLGDIAAALTLYEDHSVRPIHELTVLVDANNAPAAMVLLPLDGWKPKQILLPVDQNVLPGQRFVSEEAKCEFELRWHVLPACGHPAADADFWSQALPVALESGSSLTLEPADQLLYLSFQVFGSDPRHSSLWIADALQVLHTAGSEFNWARLLEGAGSHRIVLPLRILLGYLVEHFAVTVPAATMRQLQDMPVRWWERLEAWYGRKRANERLLGILPLLWFDFRRGGGTHGTHGAGTGFGQYLARYWQVSSRRELLALVLRLSARRLRAKFTGVSRSSRIGGVA